MRITSNRWERIDELHSLINYVEDEATSHQQSADFYKDLHEDDSPDNVGWDEYDKENFAEHIRKRDYWMNMIPVLENFIYGTPSK